MMKRIVVYKSNTGFTKQYAQWIAEALDCTAEALENTDAHALGQYDQVIFGGGVMASKINGFDDIAKMKPKDLVVFAVGYSERNEETRNSILSQTPLGNIPFFYFRGGIRYEKMNFVFRMMLKSITKEKKSCDHSNRDDIEELTEYLANKQ